jgi:polygalacturonase
MTSTPSRRDFARAAALVTGGALATGTALGRTAYAGAAPETAGDPWEQVPAILARVRPPRFRSQVFNVARYGARGDGETKNTDAFRRAIEACHTAGGGRVLVPAGTYLTGGIRMLSNVELHLVKGATILFSTDPTDYLPLVLTRWEGTLCYNYSAFVYAFEQANLAITGEGTIDGNAPHGPWASWGSGAGDELRQMGEDNVPVEKRIFGEGKKLRPNMIQFFRCRNILVQDVSIRNPAMWSLHAVFCTNVTVRGIEIYSTNSQGDGVDLDSTQDALVADSRFNTNDDCVVIKSGRDADGRRVGIPTSRVVVERCRFSGRWGGITVGSEMSGGARDIFCRDCLVNAPDYPGRYPVKYALYIKTNKDRGGTISGVHLRNVTGRDVEREALFVSMYYNGGGTGSFYPTIHDITVDGLDIDGASMAAHFEGFPQSHIRNVTISNSTFSRITSPNVVTNTDNLVLDNVTINGSTV